MRAVRVRREGWLLNGVGEKLVGCVWKRYIAQPFVSGYRRWNPTYGRGPTVGSMKGESTSVKNIAK